MDERQLVCYPRSGTCSLRGSVCCVPINFFSLLKYPFQIPYSQPKLKILLPLKFRANLSLVLIKWFLSKRKACNR